MHPQGTALVVAFSTGPPLRHYEVRSGVSPRLLPGAALPAGLQGWGEQRALAFSGSGDLLALGGQVSPPLPCSFLLSDGWPMTC